MDVGIAMRIEKLFILEPQQQKFSKVKPSEWLNYFINLRHVTTAGMYLFIMEKHNSR